MQHDLQFVVHPYETEQWILNKLNIYGNTGLTAGGASFSKNFKVEIKDGYLLSYLNGYCLSGKISEFSSYSYDIAEGFKDDVLGNIPTIVIIKIHCKEGKKCVNAYDLSDKKIFFSDNHYRIDLDESFKNENLPERMKKAVHNLIKFNGGDVLLEKY